MKAFKTIISIFLFSILANPCFALISVGKLSKDEAKELGITMKHRKNGDAGTKVWLEFRKEEFLEKFTYCELRQTDASGEHVLSAMLQPNPANHRQLDGIVSVAFSADPARLKNCTFMIVAYGSRRGDVGYVLHVKDFIDAKEAEHDGADQLVNSKEPTPKESEEQTFLQPNTWWNFYCDSEEDPLLNRSIRAVKIVETNTLRPNWVKITFPESRDEHSSIFAPAARASDNKELNFKDALAEWEQGISKWNVMWVNLGNVTRITRVEQAEAQNP